MNARGHDGTTADTPIEGTPYRICDKDGLRRLMVMGGDACMYGEMLLSAPDVLASPYARVMLNALPFPARLDDILLLGLGSGQKTRFLHRHLPATRLVTVEPDPDMVRITRTWFKVPPDDARLSVVTGDAGRYLEAQAPSCDVLLCNGYDHRFNVPERSADEGFYLACRRALRPGGVMALNLDRRCGAWHAAHLRVLGRIFAAHMELPVNESQSVLLLFDDQCERDYATLSQRARRLDTLLGLDLSAFIGNFTLLR